MQKAFIVLLLGFLVASCQKADNVVIDSSQPINISALSFFDKDSLDIAQYVSNSSAQLSVKDSFRLSLTSSQNFSDVILKVSNDSGDVIAQTTLSTLSGDSVSGSISFVPPSVYVGDLTYTFTAYNSRGAQGNSLTKLLRFFNSNNHSPVIDSVAVPDSIQVDPTLYTSIDLFAFSHDPDGLNDIKKVYFNSTLPTGVQSKSNPFLMYDDGGAAGLNIGDDDAVAGDGTYTLRIQLPPLSSNPPPVLGVYKFTFYAVDRSNATSVPFSQSIKVYR